MDFQYLWLASSSANYKNTFLKQILLKSFWITLWPSSFVDKISIHVLDLDEAWFAHLNNSLYLCRQEQDTKSTVIILRGSFKGEDFRLLLKTAVENILCGYGLSLQLKKKKRLVDYVPSRVCQWNSIDIAGNWRCMYRISTYGHNTYVNFR